MNAQERNMYDLNTAKNEYREFCKKENLDIQVFAQPWYLDAACDTPDDWQVIIYKEGNNIVAAFPFQYKRGKHGFWTISNPFLTPRLGIWIDYKGKKNRQKRESFENKITAFIINNLPPFDSFEIHFDRRFNNWHEFYRADFDQQIRYSYVLPKSEITSEYMQTLASAPRRAIQSANNYLRVERSKDYCEGYTFLISSYLKRNRSLFYSKERFEKLCKAVFEHEAGNVYFAYNNDNQPAALAITFNDNQYDYHMFASYDPDMPHGAQQLLVYNAILNAAKSGRNFDFEGSMIPGVAKYNSEFNAFREEYYVIRKSSTRLKFIRNIQNNLYIIKKTLFQREGNLDTQ